MRIFTLSSADEDGLARLVAQYEEHFSNVSGIENEDAYVENLAYTLSDRRSRLSWSATFLARNLQDLTTLRSTISRPVRMAKGRGVAYVFTGQGAQYARMGAELLQYPVFQRTLTDASYILKELGCEWSLIGKPTCATRCSS